MLLVELKSSVNIFWITWKINLFFSEASVIDNSIHSSVARVINFVYQEIINFILNISFGEDQSLEKNQIQTKAIPCHLCRGVTFDTCSLICISH